MGCCDSREKGPESNVDLKKELDDEFIRARRLVRAGCSDDDRGTDLVFFSHSFQTNSSENIRDIYDLESSTLGDGISGSVRIGAHKSTKAKRAVKSICTKGMESLSALKREVGIMRMLDHPHIIKLHEVFNDENDFLHLVMEYCSGGDLLDFTQRTMESEHHAFSEQVVAEWMRQVLSGLFYLHKHNIVHRDMKPENLMLENESTDAKVKIIDFGLAAQMKDGGHLKQFVGTPSYVAPEVLTRHYGNKVDIWSCGVICYVLLSGMAPFDVQGEDVLHLIKHCRYSFPANPWADISNDAKYFIRSTLKLNENERPEASELLGHPWLQKNTPRRNAPLSAKLVGNLKSYNKARKMKRLALTLIAQQVDQQEISQLRDTFTMLDANGDGMLSREELEQGLKTANISPEELDNLMKIDSDGSGLIDWSEFIAASLDRKQYEKREVLWNAFRVFDVNGDGSISKTELKTLLEAGNGAGVDETQVQELIADADKDGDGQIIFEEFVAMMCQSNPATPAMELRARDNPVTPEVRCRGAVREFV